MTQFPDKNVFFEKYKSGVSQVLWVELVADLETPVSAMLKLTKNKPYSFLLESVEGGKVRGRYSVLGFDPDLIWRCFGEKSEISSVSNGKTSKFVPCDEKSLESLSSLISNSKIDLPEDVPPSAAGLFGYMGYDMVRLMEKIPDSNPDVIGIPDAIFIRPMITAVFDNVADKITLVTPVWPKPNVNEKEAYDEAKSRLNKAISNLDNVVSGRPLSSIISSVLCTNAGGS